MKISRKKDSSSQEMPRSYDRIAVDINPNVTIKKKLDVPRVKYVEYIGEKREKTRERERKKQDAEHRKRK